MPNIKSAEKRMKTSAERRDRNQSAKSTLKTARKRLMDVVDGGNKDAAQAIGKAVAERALSQGIKTVCFDRGACKYHGRIAALADAAREAGLEF